MARILAHPFRLGSNGQAETVEQTSDEAHAQQIAVLALTRLGERAMVPGFGITDPLFAAFRVGELSAGIALYGPPVDLVSIDTRPNGDNTLDVEVVFHA